MAGGGRAVPVTGERNLRGVPESIGLGWTRGGRAIVYFPQAACGAGIERPGVYILPPRPGGRPRLLVETDDSVGLIRLWMPTGATPGG